MDLKQHLVRQMVWSRATFGPGSRSDGVLDHITKEIEEVRKETLRPRDKSQQPCWAALEWVDLVILSLDGLTRELWAHGFYAKPLDGNYKETADKVAEFAVELIMQKQARNERRDWPDWRTADPNFAQFMKDLATGIVSDECVICGGAGSSLNKGKEQCPACNGTGTFYPTLPHTPSSEV